MPGMDGISLLKAVSAREEPPLVVLITAYGSERVAVEALRAGAHNYLPKPFDVEELRFVVAGAVEKQNLVRQNRSYCCELEKTLASLKESQTALVQAEKIASMGRLVAGVAHEINNPLGVIESSVDTMERAAKRISREAPATGELAGVLCEAAERAKAAIGRVAHTVVNLKQFAQLDRADFQRAHIHPGIDTAIQFLRHRCGESIHVVTEYGNLPAIDCAPRELNQMFMNLLLNAIESIEARGGNGTIRIETRANGAYVNVSIADDGCGIPADDVGRIFDPGFTTKGVKVGTGLGLPICYQIAHAHRGEIDVSSRPGEGTTVTVRLPVEAGG
jgi:two-component system NtrC family sensor kinase